MIIELGKTYTTRNGDKVEIFSVDYSYQYPFFGVITTQKGEYVKMASFSVAGRYFNHFPSSFDIMAELEVKIKVI